MKRLLILLCLTFVTFAYSTGQTIIEMESKHGVYMIPCKVNGVKMKFVFDSGASAVCISASMAQYLYENGYINSDDFVGVGASIVADGRVVDHLKIILRDIEIEGMHLHNVEGIVVKGQDGSLLLGQTAIQALGPVTIDGSRLIIQNGTQTISDEQIEHLRSDATRYINIKDYHAAAGCHRKVYDSNKYNWLDMRDYAVCLFFDAQYDESFVVCEKWIDRFSDDAPLQQRYEMYKFLAGNYMYKSIPDYDASIEWNQRLITMTNALFEGEKKDNQLIYLYTYIGNANDLKGHYQTAISWYEKAFNLRMSYFDCASVNAVKKIKDEQLGGSAYDIAQSYYLMGDKTNYYKSLAISARFGKQEAINECRNLGISF